MKINVKKLSVKQFIGLGFTLVGTISFGSLVTFNEDVRTTVSTTIRQGAERIIRVTTTTHDTIQAPPDTIFGPPAPPETTDVYLLDLELLPTLEREIDSSLRGAVAEIGLRFDSVDEALSDIEIRHAALTDRVEEIANRPIPPPVVYMVVDSVFTEVDVDTLAGPPGWLRLLWPTWIKEGL